MSIESETCDKIIKLLHKQDLTFYQGIAVLEVAKEMLMKQVRELNE